MGILADLNRAHRERLARMEAAGRERQDIEREAEFRTEREAERARLRRHAEQSAAVEQQECERAARIEEIARNHHERLAKMEIVEPMILRIKKVVMEEYRLTADDISNRSRHRKFVLPRQIIMYLAAKYTNSSNSKIGREFHLDHTTVIHACKKIADGRLTDEGLNAALTAIEAKFNGLGIGAESDREKIDRAYGRTYYEAMSDHKKWLYNEWLGRVSNHVGPVIVQAVCKNYRITKTELIAPRKSIDLVVARMVVCYLAAKYTRLCNAAIAALVHRSRRTTLDLREVKKRLVADAQLNSRIIEIESRLKAMGIGVEE